MLAVGALELARTLVESDCVAATDFKTRKCPLDAVGVGVGIGVGMGDGEGVLLPPQPARMTAKNTKIVGDFLENRV